MTILFVATIPTLNLAVGHRYQWRVTIAGEMHEEWLAVSPSPSPQGPEGSGPATRPPGYPQSRPYPQSTRKQFRAGMDLYHSNMPKTISDSLADLNSAVQAVEKLDWDRLPVAEQLRRWSDWR